MTLVSGMILAMSELPSRLSVVTLGARDLSRLRRFYCGLGWAEIPSSDDDWAGFLLGGVLLALYPVEVASREVVYGFDLIRGFAPASG